MMPLVIAMTVVVGWLQVLEGGMTVEEGKASVEGAEVARGGVHCGAPRTGVPPPGCSTVR